MATVKQSLPAIPQTVVSKALRQVAAEFDAQADGLEHDWVSVLLKSGHRARIDTLREAAKHCRTVAGKTTAHKCVQEKKDKSR